jgi:penicillin amidase
MAMPTKARSPLGAPLLPPRRSRGRRLLRGALLAVAGLAGAAVLATVPFGLWLHHDVEENLPRLDGEQVVGGLEAPVVIARDALGVPTIQGASRSDVAFATGFAHAQDRFFQMDLLRRRPAGELAELFGERALPSDRELRIHRFRTLARRVLAASSPEIRSVLEAYTRGVNAGLAGLGAEPFEYHVLRATPRRWEAEDTVLVLLSMFVQLEDVSGEHETRLALLHDLLPQPVFDFLAPRGTEWDAPLVGGPVPAVPFPGPEVFDLHRQKRVAALGPDRRQDPEAAGPATAGSNSWAVAGSHTASGGALLANELHLGLAVPNLWYRASFTWPAEGGGPAHHVTGVTLPGAPAMVVGSNGSVAWGVTNSVVDTSDIVLLETDPRRDNVYRTPQGPRFLQRFDEILKIHGGGHETLPVEWSVWGPVIGKDHLGRRRAIRSMADDPAAVDFEILHLETARNVDDAVAIAHRSGVPALNLTVADAGGRIAWTIIGRLPRRVGFDGGLPGTWGDGGRRWDGLLPPEEVPALIDPPSGRLWTANNRLVEGPMLAALGDGGYVLGARARQIRDDLFAVDRATVEDMRKIQLDDRALFLARWRDLLLGLLTPQALAGHPHRQELRDLVEHWGARADTGSAGYRMVRSFRIFLSRDVFDALTAECRKADPDFRYTALVEQYEAPLWQLVTEKPANFLDPRYKTWDDQLLAVVDETVNEFLPRGPLRERTWGERNTVAIRHLLSPAIPGSGPWLDMPPRQLSGDDHMPHVQDISFGSTLRMVLSPGRDAESEFTMPGGQSGNPLSPHYGDAEAAWAAGAAAPFLPGPPVHRLRLAPKGKA